jgi:mono/diheme cytochrome c family protein
MTSRVRALLAVALGTGLLGCEVGFPAGKEPQRETNWTDMGNQPKVKPQRGDLLGLKPTGTFPASAGAVAQDEHPYRFRQDQAELAAQAWYAGADAPGKNPLPATPGNVARGKAVFENTCIVCHGPTAAGDGKVTRFFPKPPNLMRPKAREYTDARIFHVPMRGQGSMPSHAKQLDPEELWAVVHYIRDLQARSPVAPPDPKDLAPAAGAAPLDGQAG